MRRVGALCAVLALAVAATVESTAARAATSCVSSVGGLDLQRATIADVEHAMASKRVTSVKLVDAYRARIAAYDSAGPKLNAIRHLNPKARAEAKALDAERRAGHLRGPLHGVPVLVKDNYGTNDEPTTAGSIALDGVVPKDDATVVRRLRDAGAVILGKANLSEFAGWVDLNMPAGYSSLGGQVINAHDPDFSPSGSSAGSGVAASMAFAGATMGTETSGSILSPSDANGVVGVKTTLGLVSRFGILPLAPDFDVPGPMVRSVTDAAIVLGAIAGPDARDPATGDAAAHLPPSSDYTRFLKADALKGARLAYSQDAYDNLDDEHRGLFDAGIARLRKLGATVVAVHSLGTSENSGLSEIAAVPNEFKASFNRYLSEQMPNASVHSLSDVIAYNDKHPDKVKYGQNLLQASDATPGSEALFGPQADPARASAQQSIDAALDEGQADAIITPGNAHANVGASAGYPTVIEPLGYTNGGKDPFGLGFMGRAYSEPQLLGFAYAYEQSAHARVTPDKVNPVVAKVPCGRGGGSRNGGAAGSLLPLRVILHFHGHRQLRVSIMHVRAARAVVTVRRGKTLLARRRVRARHHRARLWLAARRTGTYRVTVVDPGPPIRTARRARRIR
jgi:amidase